MQRGIHLGASAAPSVSIVLQTHDRPALLDEAVRSVAAQTFTDWELIVVDDGSRPPVDAGRWPEIADRLRLLRNDESRGGAASKALGAQQARGEWIAFLDDDDLYVPDLLRRAIETLASHPAIGVLFIGVHWFGRRAHLSTNAQAESMQRVVRAAPPNSLGNDVWLFDDRLIEGLLHAIPMDFQRMVVRRSTFERIGPHRSDCLLWDCDWTLRAALMVRCALLRPRLYLQRADGQEYFSKPGRERAQMESALEMTLRLHRQPPPGTSPRTREKLREAASRHAGSLAYFHAVHGPLRTSLRAWWTSQLLRPTLISARLPLAALARAAHRRFSGSAAPQPE